MQSILDITPELPRLSVEAKIYFVVTCDASIGELTPPLIIIENTRFSEQLILGSRKYEYI